MLKHDEALGGRELPVDQVWEEAQEVRATFRHPYMPLTISFLVHQRVLL
jgi:hypothetical protein